LLGVSALTPSPNPRPLPELLPLKKGEKLHEHIAKAHPYAFNFGATKVIPLDDYKEAGECLMERNMPEVLHDVQTEVVYMPHSHLPEEPRVVDIPRFESRKRKLDEMAQVEGPAVLEQLGMKAGPAKELPHAKGDLVERELRVELKKFFDSASDKEVVVYNGPWIRVPGKSLASYQENDFVIVNKNTKTVYNIESKSKLAERPGNKATEQTQKLKKILEEFFATEFSSKDWCFVGMIYTNEINPNNTFCADCSQFIINGRAEVATKLNYVSTLLKQVVPSHTEYVSIVQCLTFVVLAHPTSTFCTITDDVVAKVEGVPAKGKTKAKAGQGDFQSIIFWTNEQAKIMLWDQPYVFFNGPWSTGKTLLMREKAIILATNSPTEKLYFVVVRQEHVKQTSLLEMELKSLFHEQHNLQNVEVLGLPTKPEDTLSSLLKEATRRPPGSWMVDEFIMPGNNDEDEMKRLHQQWSKDLEQLQKHIETQTTKPHLWIACAGIKDGKTEHFERSYLTSVLPRVFHLPQMDIPLRNTKQTLAMAGLEGNTMVKGLNEYGGSSLIKTNPVYTVPTLLIDGVQGKKFLVNNSRDEDEVASVVEAACKEVLGRTGGVGFPLIFDDYYDDSKIKIVKRGLERAGATALIYHRYSNESCSEGEVGEWLRRRRSGEEERVLILDQYVTRGWEASHLLVVSSGGTGFENFIMRAVGYCCIVKEK